MSRLNFIPHTGEQCPVTPNSHVVYKTQCSSDDRIFIHMAHKAGGCTPKEGVIDWSSRPVNRITEYAIVAKPRFTRNISPLFSYQDKLKIKAIQKQLERDEENGDL